MKDKVCATIIQRPSDVIFTCPHCKYRVNVLFEDLDFVTDYWWDGAWVDCPECNNEVWLDDFEFD